MLHADTIHILKEKHKKHFSQDDINCPAWLKNTNLPSLPFPPMGQLPAPPATVSEVKVPKVPQISVATFSPSLAALSPPPLPYPTSEDSPTSIYSDQGSTVYSLDSFINIKLVEASPPPRSRNYPCNQPQSSSVKLQQYPMLSPQINAYDNKKFKLQESIVDLLSYLIRIYKEVKIGIAKNQEWWNGIRYKRHCLDNIDTILKGYRSLTIGILKQVSGGRNSRNWDNIGDNELTTYSVFHFEYSLDKANFATLFDKILFTDTFKTNLLSYYYKSSFIIDYVRSQRTWLILPLEIWYALPSYVKTINDCMMKYKGNQELGAILLKLNSFGQQFKMVDELKVSNPITNWQEITKADEILKEKFYTNYNKTRDSVFADYMGHPLSSSHDVKLDLADIGTKSMDNELEKSKTIKRSISKMVKRSQTTSETSRTKGNINHGHVRHNSDHLKSTRKVSPNDHAKKTQKTTSSKLETKIAKPEPEEDAKSHSKGTSQLIKQIHQVEEVPHRKESLTNSDKQLRTVIKIRQKLDDLSTEVIKFLNLQLKHCKSWQTYLEENKQSYPDNYTQLIYECKLFHDELLYRINFTNTAIMKHILINFILPIDKSLRLYKQNKQTPEALDAFTEEIVAQYKKLYREDLDRIIGVETITEYQKLSQRISTNTNVTQIIEYYNQLSKLKSLAL